MNTSNNTKTGLNGNRFLKTFPPLGYILLSILYLGYVTDAMADEKGYMHWTWFTTTDGLIANDIHSMMVDREGNIWIVTTNAWSVLGRYGISVYNGKKFENSYGDEFKSINAISQDKHGTIWYGFFTTGKGIQEGEPWRRFSQRQGLISDFITCLFHDSSNNLWIGTRVGLSKYDGEHFENFTIVDGLPHNYLTTITQDKEGNIWIGTLGGACKFNGDHFTPITKEDGLAHNRVDCILQDQRGNIWFGTLGGLSLYNGNDITNFTKENGLPDNHISCMVQDDAGILWLGTHRGLSRYDGSTFINYKAQDGGQIDSGLIDNEVTSIVQARDGSLWIGTGKGLCKLTYRENE